MGDRSLTDKSSVRLTIAALVALLMAVAGFHPWAVAQVRTVVREENRVLKLEQELTRERDLAGLRKDIQTLTVEVRELRSAVNRLQPRGR